MRMLKNKFSVCIAFLFYFVHIRFENKQSFDEGTSHDM